MVGSKALLCLGSLESNQGQRQVQRPCASCSVGLCVHGQNPAYLISTHGWLCWATELGLTCGWCSGHPGPLAWEAVAGPWGERVVAPEVWALQPPAVQQATGPGREWAGLRVAGSPGPQGSWLGPQLLILFSTPPRISIQLIPFPTSSSQVHRDGRLWHESHEGASDSLCIQPQPCLTKLLGQVT